MTDIGEQQGKTYNVRPQQDRYPAKLHGLKTLRELAKATQEDSLAFFLHGTAIKYRDDTDRELPFRQESNFYYLTGCDIPGSSLLLSCTRRKDDRDDFDITSTLFILDLDDDDVMWSGMPLLPEEVGKQIEVSSVKTVSQIPEALRSLRQGTLHMLPAQEIPRGAPQDLEISTFYLQLAIQRARLVKTPFEINLIQRANDISSRAHEGVMKSLGGDGLRSEYEASAVFNYYCARNQARAMAYEVIAASGCSAGTLHYVKNNASFPSSENASLLLLDAGCEYNNYASDITRTFPISKNGKFSEEAKAIYNLVEEMQDAAFIQLKPGCSWERIHLLMHKTVAAGLLQLGILKRPSSGLKTNDGVIAKDYGDPQQQDDAREGRERNYLVQEILAAGITVAFFPHGLGHMLGLDVHDCPLASRPDEPSDNPLCRYLRYRGDLEEGHVITVEPGVYFNPFLLKPWKDSPYIDHDVLKRYMPVGGVRIEDDVLITAKGFHNLTSVKRDIASIEALCYVAVKKK